MADYQLTNTSIVRRTSDGASIPEAPGNLDWDEYQAWLAAGGVPDPYVAPPPPPPAPDVQVLYDHENRLRTIEGQPPLTLGDFLTKMAG